MHLFSCYSSVFYFIKKKSSPFTQAHPNRLQILVAVVRYKTKMHKPREGLCSSWLASLNPEQGLSLKKKGGVHILRM